MIDRLKQDYIDKVLFKDPSFMKAMDAELIDPNQTVTFNGKDWSVGGKPFCQTSKKINPIASAFMRFAHWAHTLFNPSYKIKFITVLDKMIIAKKKYERMALNIEKLAALKKVRDQAPAIGPNATKTSTVKTRSPLNMTENSPPPFVRARQILEKIESRTTRKEMIEDFVNVFLHPYITGEITQENEPKNREPMMKLLLARMGKYDPAEKSEIEEMALKAYLENGVLGLYVYLKRAFSTGPQSPFQLEDDLKGSIQPESEEFYRLVDALEKALPKDFPDRKFSRNEIIKSASEVLFSVNQQKKIQIAEGNAISDKYQMTKKLKIERAARKAERLAKLQKDKKLFLEADDIAEIEKKMIDP